MKNINEIIKKIKMEMMKRDDEVEGLPPLDKEVAKELLMTANRLAIHKKRETIPYLKIMTWCRKNKILLEGIFYKMGER